MQTYEPTLSGEGVTIQTAAQREQRRKYKSWMAMTCVILALLSLIVWFAWYITQNPERQPSQIQSDPNSGME